jgi:hypothetical protein
VRVVCCGFRRSSRGARADAKNSRQNLRDHESRRCRCGNCFWSGRARITIVTAEVSVMFILRRSCVGCGACQKQSSIAVTSESKATEEYASWAQRKIATTKVSFQSVGLNRRTLARHSPSLFLKQQFVSLLLKLCPLHDHNDFAASTTCAASMPRSFITSAPGALKPNSRSPTTLPSRPTY